MNRGFVLEIEVSHESESHILNSLEEAQVYIHIIALIEYKPVRIN